MRENISKIENNADKEGPQAPLVAQGAHDPLAPKNPPSPQNPQIHLMPNAPQVPQHQKYCIYLHHMCNY